MSEIDVRAKKCKHLYYGEYCDRYDYSNSYDSRALCHALETGCTCDYMDIQDLKEKLKNNTKFWKNKYLEEDCHSEKLLDDLDIVKCQNIKYLKCLNEIENICKATICDYTMNKVEEIMKLIKQAKGGE